MGLVDLVRNGFGQPVKAVLFLLDEQEPVFKPGAHVGGTLLLDDLIESAELVQVLSERQHVRQEIVEGLVAREDVDGLLEEHPAAVVRHCGADRGGGEPFELPVLVFGQADRVPDDPYLLFRFHVFVYFFE
jgi:hypothetical protein